MSWLAIGVIYYVIGVVCFLLFCYFEFDGIIVSDTLISFISGLVAPMMVILLCVTLCREFCHANFFDIGFFNKVLIRRK